MHPESIEEHHLSVWIIMSCIYFFLAIGSYLVLKKGWAKKQNALLGYRTLMAFRSEKTWRFANNTFFIAFFYINSLSLLINVVAYAITKDYYTGYHYARTFFGICLITLIVLLELTLIIKFNWKGESRHIWKNIS